MTSIYVAGGWKFCHEQIDDIATLGAGLCASILVLGAFKVIQLSDISLLITTQTGMGFVWAPIILNPNVNNLGKIMLTGVWMKCAHVVTHICLA